MIGSIALVSGAIVNYCVHTSQNEKQHVFFVSFFFCPHIFPGNVNQGNEKQKTSMIDQIYFISNIYWLVLLCFEMEYWPGSHIIFSIDMIMCSILEPACTLQCRILYPHDDYYDDCKAQI